MTDKEVWDRYWASGNVTVQRDKDDDGDLSAAESVFLWAALMLIALLVVACANLTIELWR